MKNYCNSIPIHLWWNISYPIHCAYLLPVFCLETFLSEPSFWSSSQDTSFSNLVLQTNFCPLPDRPSFHLFHFCFHRHVAQRFCGIHHNRIQVISFHWLPFWSFHQWYVGCSFLEYVSDQVICTGYSSVVLLYALLRNNVQMPSLQRNSKGQLSTKHRNQLCIQTNYPKFFKDSWLDCKWFQTLFQNESLWSAWSIKLLIAEPTVEFHISHTLSFPFRP